MDLYPPRFFREETVVFGVFPFAERELLHALSPCGDVSCAVCFGIGIRAVDGAGKLWFLSRQPPSTRRPPT